MKTYKINLNNNSYKMLIYFKKKKLFQGSIKSQCNDLMYSESCEPMITKEEYASFQHI